MHLETWNRYEPGTAATVAGAAGIAPDGGVNSYPGGGGPSIE